MRRRDARRGVQLQLAMQAEPRESIGAGLDGNTRRPQHVHQLQRALPGGAELLVVAGLHRQCARVEPAPHLHREPLRDGGHVHRHAAGPIQHHRLEDAQRQIEGGVPLLQEPHERAHLGGGQIQLTRAPRRLEEARRRPRVLHLGHEVEQEHVDVLDLVVPLLHRLLRNHERRDVSRDSQAPPVRLGRHHRNQLRLDRAVQLDLDEAVVGIPIHPAQRFLGRGH